jgi:predicted RND superfamily exporter protein
VDRVFRFIADHPWLMLGVLVALTALAAARLVDSSTGRFRLEIDVSMNRLLPEGDEGKEYYDFVRRVFGSDETMLVAIHADDVFTTENLTRVARLTDRIRQVEGVKDVVSLTNALNIRGTEDGLDLRPFVTEVPEDPRELERIRREALENPIYSGNLVSSDGRTTALLVYFLDFSDRDFMERGIDDRIQEIAQAEAGDAEIWLSGGPHFKVAQIRYQMQDLRRNLPMILVVLGVVLFLTFGTFRGVFLPLLTVVVALIWTMGVAATLGRPLNLVTILIPQLMLILGLSYAVHVVSEYYDAVREDPDASNRIAVGRALGHVWLPVSLTGLTTLAGFLALTLSPMGAIREFGVLAVLGIVLTVVAALTVPPTLLALLRRPRGFRAGAAQERPDRFARFAELFAGFVLEHRRAIFVCTGVAVIVAIGAATRLQVGSDSIKSFPRDSALRLDFDAVNEHLEGANQFNVVVESAEPDGFLEPVNLRAIESLQEWLEEQPEIGGTTSIVDYLKLINRGFHENDPTYLRTPETRDSAGRLLFFGANDELEGFIDRGYQRANVLVRSRVLDTAPVAALVKRIERRIEELPEGLEARITGNLILTNRLVDDLVRGQAYSLVGALVLIYGILSVMFLSFRIGGIALIPNVVPIVIYFGVLGLSGVTLNPATSLIAPMALGIAIDDTIHYFARFNQDAKRFADEQRATVSALRSVGRPVTYTSIALCVGFLVMTTSELRTWVELGALGAVTLAAAWLVDFTLTPALCSRLRVVTLWDTLTIDLGEHPEESIPAFRRLTNAQCRIVALMASLRTVPAGERLMSIGDQGKELYVVIDGRLRAWIPGDPAPHELNTHTRGDVIGGVGLFYKSRSANIDVIEDSRLLRLTLSNMDRLGRRYPRIASRLLRGLMEIVTERLWQNSERLRARSRPSGGPS